MSEKPRVLVVDDEEIVCASVRRILSKRDIEVDTVMKADEALDKLDKEEYNLVIMDLMMPEMNGIELMHAIRKKDLDVPFLMITGYPTIKTAMQALRLGAIDYIPKPFTRQELLGPVNRALRRGEALSDAEKEKSQPGEQATALPGTAFYLPEHSWGEYEQEGTIIVGIEQSFLDAAGNVSSVEVPPANEMIEQGYPTIKLTTDDGAQHSVFAPFSGRVVETNRQALDDPGKISSSEWIIRIIPSSLKAEMAMLVKKEGA